MHALWLVSWYPGRRDWFTGDFIERHAQAVSLHAKVTVVAVLKDELLQAGKVEIEKSVNGNLVVYRVYYGKSKWPSFVESMLSVKNYLSLHLKLFHRIESEHGRPSIVHVQVAMKAGLAALILRRKYQLPYVVTEHWTGYYPQSKPCLNDFGFIYRWFNQQVLKKAAMFLPVTKDLGETINKNFVRVPYKVVPNVVNTDLFYYLSSHPAVFRFIHPSVMNYQKNPQGILQACINLKNRGQRFELLMIGSDDMELKSLVEKTGLLDTIVFFKGTISYEQVALEMRQSSALVLFSRFENLPCVILEALCCGLPVISSGVGGIEEVINDTNGILVQSENIDQLTEAMQTMINDAEIYNRSTIAENASNSFSYATVGMQYYALYQQLLANEQ